MTLGAGSDRPAHSATNVDRAAKQADPGAHDEAMRVAERFFHLGYWQHNMDVAGQIAITLTAEACRIAGFEPGQAPQTLSELREWISADDRPIQAAALERAQRGEVPYDVEYRLVRPDGAVRHVRSAGEVTRDEAGRASRAFGAIQDITERKRAEQQLHLTTTLLEAVAEGTTDAVFVKDRDGHYLFFNAGASTLVGKPASEVLGRDDHAILDPDSARMVMAYDRQIMESGIAGTKEFELSARGVTRITQAVKAPYRDDRGNVIGVIGVSRDITEQKRALMALRAAEERLRYVVASSPAILFALAIQSGRLGSISWMSENVAAMLGYRAEDTIETDWWLSNIHPEDRDHVEDRFRSEILNRGHSAAEYRFRHANGEYRWIHSEARLQRGAEGQPSEVVGSISDITERKKLENQFHQAQKMEAVGQLAGGVAHDFNNLLTVISNCTSLLLDEPTLSTRARNDLLQISKATASAARLTRQLLAFSRQQVLAPTALNLNVVVRDAEKMLQRVLGERVQLHAILDPTLGTVMADVGHMEQVILNLAINARDAMLDGGTLTFETSNVDFDEGYGMTHTAAKAGAHVMLAICDSGVGMDERTRAHIFEPFFTTKEPGRGTGLGLATVYGIIKQSEGFIRVQSEPGRGTTFRIYLPRTNAAALSERPPVARPADRGEETILLVEDVDALREVLKRVLEGKGYHVLAAADGPSALRLADAFTHSIDLLLTDIGLPGMSGPQVWEELQRSRPEMRVLFASGYTSDATMRRDILAGEFAFLNKPFTPETLARRVRDVLDPEEPRSRAFGEPA